MRTVSRNESKVIVELSPAEIGLIFAYSRMNDCQRDDRQIIVDMLATNSTAAPALKAALDTFKGCTFPFFESLFFSEIFGLANSVKEHEPTPAKYTFR